VGSRVGRVGYFMRNSHPALDSPAQFKTVLSWINAFPSDDCSRDADAQNNLGCEHENGLGVEKDYIRALCYREADNQDDADK